MSGPQVLTPREEQNTWQYKAVVATKGNQTLVGCILLALIDRQPRNGPRVETTATVDEKGFTFCGFTRRNGVQGVVCIGTIQDIRDEFRRLADHLKLDDVERIELFDELKKWVAVDLRADHNELKK